MPYTRVTEEQFELKNHTATHLPTGAWFGAHANLTDIEWHNWGICGDKQPNGEEYDRDEVWAMAERLLAARELEPLPEERSGGISLESVKINWSAGADLRIQPMPFGGEMRYGGKHGSGTLAGCVRAFLDLPNELKFGAMISIDHGGIAGHGDLMSPEEIEAIASRSDFPG